MSIRLRIAVTLLASLTTLACGWVSALLVGRASPDQVISEAFAGRIDSLRSALAFRGKVAFARGRYLVISNLDGSAAIEIDIRKLPDKAIFATPVFAPLSFSPDGTKLAVHFQYQDSRIYVVETGGRTSRWITKGLERTAIGNTTWWYFHRGVSWSPNGRHLAVLTSGGPDSSVGLSLYSFERDTLRFLHRHHRPGGIYDDDTYLTAWRGDSNVLYGAFPSGARPPDLLAIDARDGGAQRIFVADSPSNIRGLATNPIDGSLAFAVGRRLYLYENGHAESRLIFPEQIERLYWSPNGKRLAARSILEDLLILSPGDTAIWDATAGIAEKFVLGNAIWISDHQVVFALVLRTDETRIYMADVDAKKRLLLIDHDAAFSDLSTVPGFPGFLYSKITSRAPWERARGGSPFWQEYRYRRVSVDIQYWDHATSKAIALTSRGAIPAIEDEGNFSVYVNPIYSFQSH